MSADTPISVVVPAYNAGRYIGATIASVRAQSLRVREIIVVDDGSEDDTVAVARAAGAIVLEQRNAGVSVARNHGIGVAAQPWIALVDADDLWEHDKLERQWSSLTLAPQADFSFCDYSQFDERRVRNASVLHEVHAHFAAVERTALGDAAFLCDSQTLGAALLVQNVIQPSALLIRRDTVLEMGGFDARLLACQDYDFFLRLVRDRVGTFVDLPLVRYRRHATATTSNIPKSREGLAGVALRAISHPWRYSPETVTHFRDVLPNLLFKCGFAHLRYGEPAAARTWLKRSLGERFSLSGALLFGLSFAVETQLGRRVRSGALSVAGRAASTKPEMIPHLPLVGASVFAAKDRR
jgi:glycosyltransferase involved in cell wall biosynthesis